MNAVLRFGAVRAVGLALSGTLVGCGVFGSHPRDAAHGSVSVKMVRDEELSDAVVTLLRDGTPSVRRQRLLAGVVQRQLAHAGERLRVQQRDRGLAGVVGALFLVRAGELRPEMFAGSGERTLELATDVVAATGDEGKSLALYNLRRQVLPAAGPARIEVDQHLKALELWVQRLNSQPGLGPVEVAGMIQRRSTARSLFEPTKDALSEAARATGQWADAGMTFQSQFRTSPHSRPKREEAMEGYRAVSSAAAILAAVYLRNGDAAGAFDALTGGNIEHVAPPTLLERLQAAVQHNQPNDWRALLDFFARFDVRDEEMVPDRDLLRAAVFGVAVEAYRRDPTDFDVATQLAATLVAVGIPEAAPAVLAAAARAHPDPTLLSRVLEAVVRVMIREEEGEDPASAQRVFAATAPLLSLAEQGSLRGRIRPSPASIRLLTAGIASRAGNLSTARSLLESAAREEPSAQTYRMLASVDRQTGRFDLALRWLGLVIASAEAQKDRVVEAEAHWQRSEILRERGQRDLAKQALASALRAALAARTAVSRSSVRAVVAPAERMIARLLDLCGDDAGAARATDRALAAAQGDDAQFLVTVLEALARAYVARDIATARRVARKALGNNVREDDLVYVGLWLRLLEKETKTRPDGTAEDILGEVKGGLAWPGRLVAWAHGKINDGELARIAHTNHQRIEARFYTALARRAAGQPAERLLTEITQSPAIDLMEMQLARDLLAGTERRLPGLPPDIRVP